MSIQTEIGGWAGLLPETAIDQGNAAIGKADALTAAGETVYPPREQVFAALQTTPPERVKVCIVGQDPYHGPGQANGLAFSVAPGCKLPPSLRNIFKELCQDIGCDMPANGDLTPWAEQGVLLLNSVLTVSAGKANSHASFGWREFTSAVYRVCAELPQPVVFITWGAQARTDLAALSLSTRPNKRHIWSSHPSPLGAHKSSEAAEAFIGSKPFSTANRLLIDMGVAPIDWNLLSKLEHTEATPKGKI